MCLKQICKTINPEGCCDDKKVEQYSADYFLLVFLLQSKRDQSFYERIQPSKSNHLIIVLRWPKKVAA